MCFSFESNNTLTMIYRIPIIFCVLVTFYFANGQEKTPSVTDEETTFNVTNNEQPYFRRNAIKVGTGFGFEESYSSFEGIGFFYSVGYQRSFSDSYRWRLSPNLTMSEYGFSSLHSPSFFYRKTKLSMDFHYDFLRVKALSVVTMFGAYIDYRRGYVNNLSSNSYRGYRGRFNDVTFGVNGALGLRVAPKFGKTAFELKFMSGQIDNALNTEATVVFTVDFRY